VAGENIRENLILTSSKDLLQIILGKDECTYSVRNILGKSIIGFLRLKSTETTK
jgi:hypothetical protein